MQKQIVDGDSRLSIHPGEWYFGSEVDSLFTVLGTCVALVVWHPSLKLGGLCHYLLPKMPHAMYKNLELFDEIKGRYGNTALALMKDLMSHYAPLSEFQLRMYGGSESSSSFTIGEQNIVYAQQWLKLEHLKLTQMDFGGRVSRSLVFEMATGEVKVKHYAMQEVD